MLQVSCLTTADAPQKAINKTAEGKFLLLGRQGRSWEPLVVQTILAASLLCLLPGFFFASQVSSRVFSYCTYLTWGEDEKYRLLGPPRRDSDSTGFVWWWEGEVQKTFVFLPQVFLVPDQDEGPPCDHRVTDFFLVTWSGLVDQYGTSLILPHWFWG